MRICVSACLLGERCKYNGGDNGIVGLAHLLLGHEVVTVCPEVLGGLPTPRSLRPRARTRGNPRLRLWRFDRCGTGTRLCAIIPDYRR